MEFAASFSTDRFSRLRHTWQFLGMASAPTEAVLLSASDERTPGGEVVRVVFRRRHVKVLQRVSLPRASGLTRDWYGRGLVACTYDGVHLLDRALRVSRSRTSPRFCALHSVSPTMHGYLIPSTGIDEILEVDRAFRPRWSWSALEHGFPRDRSGARRTLPSNRNHARWYYPLQRHTVHVNSAVEDRRDGSVLATLFHQGSIVSIDRSSGRWRTVARGLAAPHSLRPDSGCGYVLSESRRGSIVRIDASGEILRFQVAGSTWLQSVFPMEDGYLTTDADSHRVMWLRRDGRIRRVWRFPGRLKVYDAISLD